MSTGKATCLSPDWTVAETRTGAVFSPTRPDAAATGGIVTEADASGRVGESTAPVRVSATVQSGDKQVALPVEITVKNGQGQVEIHLKILIDLKGLG